jgi:Ala-tRNA(Pro) deacylase
LGVVNDVNHRVKVVLDERLMKHEIINSHPLTNEATTSIHREDLLIFLETTGHHPLILKIDGSNPN